jgi:hypothetical protein
MAFDVVMFGSLSVPERNLEEWLASPVELADFPWLDEVGGVDVPQDTPEALLSFLGDVTCAPHELFEVSLREGQLTVQCYATEDTFRETSQALALLFASSAAFGGLGELTFSGYQGIRFGERLSVRGGRGTFTRIAGEALARVEQQQVFVTLDAKIHERFDALVGRTASGPVDPRRSRWSIHPFTGRKVRVSDDSTAL